MTVKFLNSYDFSLRWGDIDSYHHVNQTRYFDAMTEARVQWLYPLRDEVALGCAFYVVETSCCFYKSFTYPGIMRITQYVLEVKHTSFTLEYHFSIPENEKCYAKGIVKLACIDIASGKPTRLPESIRNALL